MELAELKEQHVLSEIHLLLEIQKYGLSSGADSIQQKAVSTSNAVT